VARSLPCRPRKLSCLIWTVATHEALRVVREKIGRNRLKLESAFCDLHPDERLVRGTAKIGPRYGPSGSVASFGTEQEFAEKTSFLGTLGGHFEEFVDELILTPDATPAQPPHLALPNYVYRLIALNRSSRSLEFPKPLLGVHSPFDRTMVLLDDVVQILDGSVAAPAAERPFLLYICDDRAVDRRQIRVDDAGLRMR